MELTQEEARTMIENRLNEHPEMRAIVAQENFRDTLLDILEIEDVSEDFLPIIENEVLVILSFYAPLRSFAQNIQETTGLSQESSENIATLVETLLFEPVLPLLTAFDHHQATELQKLNTPEEIPNPPHTPTEAPHPLTREEVLRSFTMPHSPEEMGAPENKTTI